MICEIGEFDQRPECEESRRRVRVRRDDRADGGRFMDTRQQARATMEFARMFTKGILDETLPDKWLVQPTTGVNHVLWNVGHLGVSNRWVRGQIESPAPPGDADWRNLFSAGSTPVSDGAVYPKTADVRAYYEKEWDALLALLDRMSDAELAAPVSKDAAMLAKNKLGLFYFAAWHEGMHAGEIAAIRKALGLKPKFG
jgi:hypothetical protein